MAPRKNKNCFILGLSAALSPLLIWTIWENLSVGVTRYRLETKRLPHDFDGFKIVVISDFHNAEFGDDNSRIVKKIEIEKPDLIALTGDLIDSRRPKVDVALTLTQQLTKIAPCYYVSGNHESRVGPLFTQLKRGLIDQGVVLLDDRVIPLERHGQIIQIAGIGDPGFVEKNRANLDRAILSKIQKLSLTSTYRILLSHHPEAFHRYVDEDLDLVLCGHAHGGQIRLPVIGGLFAPNQGLLPQFDSGTYTKGQTTMIVSRGIGNSLFPIRFNNRPEIVLIELNDS